MRLIDPSKVKRRLLRETVIFAGSQLTGKREIQEDYFINFNDEFFAVADGLGGMPHGEVASRLACETATWAYKHIRQRPFYWADKKSFLKRIFRTSNLTIWQKRREKGFEDGLATTLSVAMVGPQRIWVGSVGDTSILLYREGLIDELTPIDLDHDGRLTNALGLRRLGLVPHIAVETFLPGDLLIIATDGVIGFVSEDELRVTCDVVGDTLDSITNGLVHLLKTAEENGSGDNMTAFLIKKMRSPK